VAKKHRDLGVLGVGQREQPVVTEHLRAAIFSARERRGRAHVEQPPGLFRGAEFERDALAKGHEDAGLDALAVEEGAVAAPEVAQVPTFAVPLEHGVLVGDEILLDAEVAVTRAPDEVSRRQDVTKLIPRPFDGCHARDARPWNHSAVESSIRACHRVSRNLRPSVRTS
jgi:hypothetical protein